MIEAVLSAIGGAVLASTATYLFQNYLTLKSLDVAFIDDFIDDLERIENLSISYWSGDKKNAASENIVLAPQIRGALHASTVFFNNAQRLLANDYSRFMQLDGRLFDLTTGGNFESKYKAPDPGRVVEIMECTNELRQLLRHARRKTFWAR